MTTGAHSPKKGYRTIRLPLAESEYDRFLTDRSYAKDRLEELYEECAELFPDAFPSGYAFFGYTEPSIKQPGYNGFCGSCSTPFIEPETSKFSSQLSA